ncbi:hypothetical protein PQR53_38000 [Paraburkholderia fungorum]
MCNYRGRPVVTWQLYEALLAKKAGIAVADAALGKVELCFD